MILIRLRDSAAVLPHDAFTVFLSQGLPDKRIPNITRKTSQARRHSWPTKDNLFILSLAL